MSQIKHENIIFFYEREMQLHSTAFGNQKICLSKKYICKTHTREYMSVCVCMCEYVQFFNSSIHEFECMF